MGKEQALKNRRFLETALLTIDVGTSSYAALFMGSDRASEPCCLTILLYTPMTSKGAAHCPTNKDQLFLAVNFKIADAAMHPRAAPK